MIVAVATALAGVAVLVLAVIANAGGRRAAHRYFMDDRRFLALHTRAVASASYPFGLFAVMVAGLAAIEAKSRWFTSPAGQLIGVGVLIAILAGALWDAYKAFDARTWSMIASFLSRAAPTNRCKMQINEDRPRLVSGSKEERANSLARIYAAK